MAGLKQLEAVQQELRRRLPLEHDYSFCQGLRAAIQTTDVIEVVVDALMEQDRSLQERSRAAAKRAGRNPAAQSILSAAKKILAAEDPGLPDLLAAWSVETPSKPDRHIVQLWFATEAFALACYRQAVGLQLQLLSYGILFPPSDGGEWQRLERSVASLVSAAGAAAMVAQRARKHKYMEEQVGSRLCGNLEHLAGIAAALHVLLAEWAPSPQDARGSEDILDRLERLFQRSELWVDEAVRLLEVPVGYQPPLESEGRSS